MKQVALVFVVAVFVPSLVLAWLAVRSLRDQQFLLERQQSLLYQGVADARAKDIQDTLAAVQRDFQAQVHLLVDQANPRAAASSFDDRLLNRWPLAQVGFVVSLTGDILAPPPHGRPEARRFAAENSRFLANRDRVEVYLNSKSAQFNQALAQEPAAAMDRRYGLRSQTVRADAVQEGNSRLAANPMANWNASPAQAQGQPATPFPANLPAPSPVHPSQMTQSPNAGQPAPRRVPPVQPQPPVEVSQSAVPGSANALAQTFVPEPQAEPNRRPGNRAPETRSVVPQQQVLAYDNNNFPQLDNQNQNQLSKVAASAAEFRQLIGDDTDGALARFVDNKLNVLFWCRPAADPDLVFGTELALPRLLETLRPLVERVEPALRGEICLALLDDTARPVATSHPGFRANWKRPFVATEIGETLPHWEVAVYLLDPAKITQSARTVKLTLGLLIGVLVLAIGMGSWLIVTDLGRQLALARQKTDFVSNVSHELKTPLTSIRMFSELLSEGRVADPERQRAYLGIIAAEAARLTRLINNVLDFARLERGEKNYHFQPCDLARVAGETAASFRPHLEAGGFQFDSELPEAPLRVKGDPDALAQVIVNLLSNAGKYSGERKEILLRLGQQTDPLPYAELEILDRGLGVPLGSEEKIFEQFYRAHDSLSSGIQGSGLGLTLARQIARAHGGDVVYRPREGGGSCFSLRLPLLP